MLIQKRLRNVDSETVGAKDYLALLNLIGELELNMMDAMQCSSAAFGLNYLI